MWHSNIFRNASETNECEVGNFAPKLVAMTIPLKASEKGQTDHLRANTYHLIKKIMKTGLINPVIIGLQETIW